MVWENWHIYKAVGSYNQLTNGIIFLIRFLKHSSTPLKSTWLLIYQFYFQELLRKLLNGMDKGLTLQISSKILRL